MPFCNCLEDEFHFVLECQLYQDLRNEYEGCSNMNCKQLHNLLYIY